MLVALLACRDPAPVREPPLPPSSIPTSPGSTAISSPATPTGSTSPTGSTERCDAVGLEIALDPTGLAPGETLSLGDLDEASVPTLSTATVDAPGGVLLFSDSPESVPGPALLYQDRVQGDARLYLYHVTGRADPLRYDVIVSGLGRDTTVTWTAEALSGPWHDYLYVGREGALRYEQQRAAPPAPTSIDVPGSGSVVLDPALDALTTRSTWLMHGIWDLSAADPVMVSFVAVDPADDPVAALPDLAPAARDVHDRGTFAPTERERSACYDPSAGALRIRLADGSTDDPWAEGADAIGGTAGALHGNYGLHYTIALDLRFAEGHAGDRTVTAALAPRGGPIAGAAWVDDRVFDFPTDADQIEVGDAAVLGTWDPAEHDRVEIRWTPAGGSSLPVDLLLIPR